MCKVKMLRTLVKQRLNVAVEEIFELIERTLAEYEKEFSRDNEKNELSDAPLKVPSHEKDVQQMLVESQDQEPADSARIKEEQAEMWSSQDVEQLQVLEQDEANISTGARTGVLLKTEDKVRSSQPRHSRRQKNRRNGMTEDPITESSDSDHSEQPKELPKAPKTGDMTAHAAGKQFICSECGKIFVHKGTLNRHMKTHTGEKPFSCAVCAKRFSTNSGIKVHMRTHTGEKPFACSFCPQRFPIKSNMKIHVRVKHTGEKPFACSVCPQRFSRKSAMKLHVQVKHAGVKPFACSLCPKRFSTNKNVMIHMRTHTGEKAFGCNKCAQRFSYKYQLDKHRCAVVGADTVSLRLNTLLN